MIYNVSSSLWQDGDDNQHIVVSYSSVEKVLDYPKNLEKIYIHLDTLNKLTIESLSRICLEYIP
jgi:hypothetical protein